MKNGYIYTVAEFIHLFVDIKHMRPVTEVPVVDLTFQFHLKIYFLKSLHFGYFKICEPKSVTKME